MALVLTFHHEDDLLEVIDRVLAASDRDILLVFPDGARIFSSEENFLLLKREAEAGGKHISLRTEDHRGKFLASRTGIPLTGTADASSPRRRFSDILPPQPVSENIVEPDLLMADGEWTPPLSHQENFQETPEGSREETVFEQEFRKKSFRERWRWPGWRFHFRAPSFFVLPFRKRPEIWVIALGVIVLFLAANEVLAGVKVTIHPRSESLAFSLPVRVVVGSAEESDVAGQKIRSEEILERSIDASGSAEATSRAQGVATIYNSYSSATQTLVASTRLVSQSGKLFRLDATTVVPGAKVEDGGIIPASVDVRVTADEAGPEYNIGPSTFSIPGFQGTPKFTAFTARSSEPMAGGARGTVKIVTAQDIERAKEGLAETLSQKLNEKFREQTPKDLMLLEDAVVETVSVATDISDGAHADRVVAKAQGQRSAIVFAEADLRRVVEEALAQRIPQETNLLPGSLQISSSVKDRDIEKGRLSLQVNIEARAAWRIDADAVREALAGKKEEEIRGWAAQQDAIESAQVRFTPFWITSAPKNRDRIKVEIDTGASHE